MYERMEVQFLALVNLNATRGKWSVSCLGHLTPGKEPQYTIEEKAGWTPEPLPRSKLQSVQPIASRYADSAIPRPTETIVGYHLTVWTGCKWGLKQATLLSWSFVLKTLSGHAHWYQWFITTCFYPDAGGCKLLQNAGIYHIFQTVRSTVSWKYYIQSSCVLLSDGI